MKSKSEKKILKKLNFNSMQIDNSIQNTTLCIPEMTYQKIEAVRASIFEVCNMALDNVLQTNDKEQSDNKIYEIKHLLEFGGNLRLMNEAKTLDQLNDLSKKKLGNDLKDVNIVFENVSDSKGNILIKDKKELSHTH